jgi:hypothetical protein
VRIKLVNVFEYKGATIRGKRIRCACKHLRSLTEETYERHYRLELEDAICVVDIPYGLEKFK